MGFTQNQPQACFSLLGEGIERSIQSADYDQPVGSSGRSDKAARPCTLPVRHLPAPDENKNAQDQEGVLLMIKAGTPLFERDPYRFSLATWGWLTG